MTMRFRRNNSERDEAKPASGKRRMTGDRMLVLAGFGLAGCAALLPWYAVVGGQGLGIRNDGLLRLSGHAEDWSRYGSGGFTRPFGGPGAAQLATKDVDSLSTGTIPEISETFRKAKDAAEAEDQPFPGRPFHIVHVANGQALISDGRGMYLVSVGSKLPDNSVLKTFEEHDGEWVIVTSNGAVIGR